MANLRHIRIEQTPTKATYTYPRKVFSAEFKHPPRDRAIHAQNLTQQIQHMTDAAAALHPQQPPGSYGIAAEFHSDPHYLLKIDSLEYRKSGIELANVREKDSTWFATVYVPPGKMSFFLRRINKYATENHKTSGEAKEEDREDGQVEDRVPEPQAGNQPWAIGQKLRARGSIHSDWWEGSASDLAACGHIGICPVTGWWRERHHLGRWNRAARYSLIVTLETERTDIDLYTAIATQVGIAPQIKT